MDPGTDPFLIRQLSHYIPYSGGLTIDPPDLEDEVEKRRTAVNERIGERLDWSDEVSIHGSSRYLVDSGGKRLRPVLLLLAAEVTSDADSPDDMRELWRKVLPAALGIEMIHSFSLVHDDIMDEDDYRRGVETVERRWSQTVAILTGDFLYSQGFELFLEPDAEPESLLEVMRLVSEGCSHLCRGQALDMEFEDRTDVNEDEYLRMVEWKTAKLFSVAARSGSLLENGNRGEVGAIGRYAENLGKAFQIRDDVLDVAASSEATGKPRGSDLVEGKNTMVTVHARRNGVDLESVDRESTEEEVLEVIDEMRDAGSIDYARKRTQEFVEEARNELDGFPDSGSREILDGLAEYVGDRDK
ncbi:MAG: polyprenyl synthetase family protein [Halobacteria archaeon]